MLHMITLFALLTIHTKGNARQSGAFAPCAMSFTTEYICP